MKDCLLVSYCCRNKLIQISGLKQDIVSYSSDCHKSKMVPTSQQMERIFAPEWIVSRPTLIPNLDDLDDEIWEFSADETSMRFWT